MKNVAKKVAKKAPAKKAAPKLNAEQRRANGIAKQRVSLVSTMALTDKDWQRGLVCLSGKNKGKVAKNPRRACREFGWFKPNQKTILAKKLYDAAKEGKYPVMKVDGIEYQLVFGLSKAAQKRLVQVGEW